MIEGRLLGDEQPTLARASPGGSEPRFAPGTLLAGRYRVIYPLGRGGMGEVYRADDLKLGQAVALKFVRSDMPAIAKQRLYSEVRLGRQVSHPNVCRLYDLVEVEGLTFIAMEYVDGEDLASLLLRIGHLAADKALEIARGLCVGLLAAHDRGVLHRDLKPANVMIDGRGRARLTDFGLAVEQQAAPPRDTAGTALYMSPEQLAGGELSVKSDLYSLGLILYEMVAGRRFFNAGTPDELRSQHRAERLSRLGVLSGQVDPAFERVIAQCLEEDPQARPASARALLALLPGGDPLDAAIAAGETPAPDVVAAAGTVGDLRPAVAWGALLTLLLGLALVGWVSDQQSVIPRRPPPMTPEILVERARHILTTLGHVTPPADSSRSYDWDGQQIRHVFRNDRSPDRFYRLRDAPLSPLRFFYRQSPASLVAANRNGSVERGDPPADVPGMAEVDLDTRGRLMRYLAVPPRVEAGAAWRDPDWSPLFQAAGLDSASFRSVSPEWTAPVDSDSKAAWAGVYTGTTDLSVRIEAAAFHGRPVWFAVLPSWAAPEPVPIVGAAGPAPFPPVVLGALGLVVPVGSLVLARRNLRLRRGDRKGALRVAVFVFVAYSLARLCRADHVPGFGEFWLLLKVFAYPMAWAALVWVLYLALEPYARRRFPRILISWGRLLDGRWRDPMVGRDVLVGAAAGAFGVGLYPVAESLVSTWLGQPQPASWAAFLDPASLTSWTNTAFRILVNVYAAALWSIIWLFVLVLLRIVLRKDLLALVAWCVAVMVPTLLAHGALPGLVLGLPFALLELLVLTRFGLLGYGSLLLTTFVLTELPLTFDASVWWAPRGFVALAVVAAMAVYGFRTALAGKPAFGGEWLET